MSSRSKMQLRKFYNLNLAIWIFIGHEQEVDGFIAHELQEVAPYAVTGVKDAVNEDGSIITQQIDTSKLIALLTASLQDLHGIVKQQQIQIDLQQQQINKLLGL